MARNNPASAPPPQPPVAFPHRPLNFREAFALLAFIVLMVTVMTNLISFYFLEEQLITVRPMVIILALGSIVVAGAVPFSIDLPPMALGIACGLGGRFLDAAMLKRYVDFEDAASRNTAFALVFFGVSYVGLRVALRARRRLALALVACSAVAIGSITVDYFVPGFFPVTSGRAAGYFINSNGASFALGVLLFAAVPLVHSNTLRVLFICVTIFGSFITLSRGGFLALLVGVLAFMRGGLRLRALLFAGVALVITFASLSSVVDQLQSGNEELNTRARLLLGRDAGAIDDSGRGRLLMEGFAMGMESPWIGYGATYSNAPRTLSGQGPHNLYVGLLVDEGVPGALFGMVIMGALGVYCFRWCRAFFPLYLVLFVTAFFSHNLPESSVFLFALALICVAGEPAYFAARRH
ncbi:MAG: O-antigen ligase family protein [Candidatus Didemnitutus sp.]|nr:O-antigen ligase family protein [Candidatus Didemnitutus sp.]